MTEKRLLSFVLTEGILLLLLGILTLVLPKITEISFVFMLSLAFILYGGYRVIASILTRNYSGYFLLNFISGLILLIAGLFLIFAQSVDIMLIMSLIGLYFIITSLSVSAFAIRGEGVIHPRRIIFLLSVLEIFFGVIVITTLSGSGLWLAGVLAGIDFLISGIVFTNVYLACKNRIV